ncbi:hypothetical protein [Dyella japonica]|uniref:hypothetical protein n=1 Tax=Dyella japonica TaxID=231455 RepID=UPI000ACDBC47|nr:hypothetical protein [Dyella japonica]
MKDFFDRVTARALGGESMLSPRLPSLFEPQRGLPTGWLEEVSEQAAPTERQAVSTEQPAVTRRDVPASPTTVTMREVAKVPPAMQPEQPSAVRQDFDNEPPVAAPIVRSNLKVPKVSQLSSSRPAPAPLEPPAPPARVQRELMLEALPATERRTVHDEGSLLTPTPSVFRTSPATAHARSPVAQAGQAMQPAAAHEPTVHVSIGRLEIRATPAPAKAAPRQDAPRSSPLDDYLRQRGKASP